MLFADDAALATPNSLVDRLSQACDNFGLKISRKKTQIKSRDTKFIPNICIGNHVLEVVENFVYLGTNINKNLAMKNEINSKMEKASSKIARLSKKV